MARWVGFLASTIAALALAACGAREVTQSEPGTFTVSAQELLPTGGWPAAQREATEKAAQFCAARGERSNVTGVRQEGRPGFTPLASFVTFTCGPDTGGQMQAVNAQCTTDMQTTELDPIRAKVELLRTPDDPPPAFELASNDTFPTEAERPVIAKWATLRDACIKRISAVQYVSTTASTIQAAFSQQERAFGLEANGRISELVIALYQAKLTYGEFAQKRYEIVRDMASAERQFRAANAVADRDHQLQAQQVAQQQAQNRLIAWSTYVQAVSARQPQTVNIQGSVRLQTNCTSTRMGGGMVSTNCN